MREYTKKNQMLTLCKEEKDDVPLENKVLAYFLSYCQIKMSTMTSVNELLMKV